MPKHSFYYRSSLNPAQIISKITTSLEDHPSFQVRLFGDRFQISKKGSPFGIFKPVLYGRIDADSVKTIVRGFSDMDRRGKTFLSIWFFSVFLTCIGVLSIGLIGFRVIEAEASFFLVLLSVFAVTFAGCLKLMKLPHRSGANSEANMAGAWLRELFGSK